MKQRRNQWIGDCKAIWRVVTMNRETHRGQASLWCCDDKWMQSPPLPHCYFFKKNAGCKYWHKATIRTVYPNFDHYHYLSILLSFCYPFWICCQKSDRTVSHLMERLKNVSVINLAGLREDCNFDRYGETCFGLHTDRTTRRKLSRLLCRKYFKIVVSMYSLFWLIQA